MAKDYSRAFYDSPAWRKCRKGYISKRQSIDGGVWAVVTLERVK